ncbi:centromere-associated protein E-like isoform X1 [Macrosteles quadrilineatus]|uniref:centromere-associated protein E-like isoform X1 n=1 Tax=Macrosteles quadrilineatus TaxID=74068 RepID=UPI0023E31330|nr:centromere-associated protein E-like isoform X1 [Macrosteles quadrilineatus]
MEEVSQENEPNIQTTDQPPGTGLKLSGISELTDIEAIKDRIEQQKANKLKAEQLVSTLSRIKARERARRIAKSGEKKTDDGGSNSPAKRSGTNSSSTLKEKSNLLKKKLEEDRARFENKKGQEDLGRVSEIVEHIRVQLEDQDKTIQQMHSNFTSPKPQHVEEVTPPEPDLPPEVKQKIADLEMKVLDLQENLREKDSVISARTQAITLLSEDMARKGKATLDTLEETRSQMKTMQANFVALEQRMGEERTRLKDELETKKLKLQQLEKNYRAAESARFDLSTRVAELQEKVVAVQTKNVSLEEEVAAAAAKAKELTEALENSNKQTIKMKAQFKVKLKALEEERDLLKKENTNEEMNRLRERIADLEDEKGNLQLHLVDFDEIQDAGVILKERIAEMEEKLQRQESDLDSHIKAITQLEAEKLDLIEGTKKMEQILKDKESLLETLKLQISQIEESKISAEMKCLELEEKMDTFVTKENESTFINSELESSRLKLIEFQGIIADLTAKLESKEHTIQTQKAVELEGVSEIKNIQNLSSSLEEWQERYRNLEERLNATLAHCDELEKMKKNLETENEKLVKDCVYFKETVEQLNQMLQTKGDSPNEEIISLKQLVAQKNSELSSLGQQSQTLQGEVDSLREALQSTTAEVYRLYEQVEQLSNTQQKVEELNESLHGKEKALEERTRKLSEYKKFHKLKSEDVIRISHELETVSASLQQRIAELEEDLNNARKIEETLRNENQNLKENKSSGTEPLEKKLEEQSLKMKKLAANLKLKTKLVKDLEAKVEELDKTLQQKDIEISELHQQLAGTSQLSNVVSTNAVEIEEKCRHLVVECNSLKEELKVKSLELETLKNSTGYAYDPLVQIKELENQNQKLADISATKSEQLKKMECELSELNGLNKSLMTELEQMQENYKQDALKNVSVLEGFENEMIGNKREILEVSEQLRDVTAKYQQTWAKLQEKEGYVEELENQLEKVRLRLSQIESSVEERRRSLEEKAELLGARLCQAEKNNEELEKHKGELEQKISHLFSTEEMLGSALERLQSENKELSMSLNDSSTSNIKLSQDLACEQNKVLALNKEIVDLQSRLYTTEKTVDDYEKLKLNLKELQDARDSQVKYLENRLTETEQSMEIEIQRCNERIVAVESERQDVVEKYQSLCLEKQVLEEEFNNMQQTIVDITKEELEELKNNQKILEEELNKEFDKRESHIGRIKELESQLSSSNAGTHSVTQPSEELMELRKQLNEERNENERLKYELLKEKASQQVDDVVAKAQETYFTMAEVPLSSSQNIISSIQENVTEDSSDSSQSPPSSESKKILAMQNKITELENQLSSVNSENVTLKTRLQELEVQSKNVGESNALLENEEWASGSKDEDDGWGWGSKDALLEHEYSQKQKVNSELETKVSTLESRLRDQELENIRLNDELKAAQTKCTKLFKKVKEFKNKSDSLERSSRERSVGFDDLDIAMQEEMKSQIEKLEKSLKECTSNLNSLQTEREGLLKRIDTLTSGNERLIEMKERQDIEVEMWQRRSNDLQHKVQGLEWTIAELQEQTDTRTKENIDVDKDNAGTNASEMEEKLNTLAAENDYLQSLLVELKDKEKKQQKDLLPVTEGTEFEKLKEDNERLNSLVQSLEKQLITETENTNISGYLSKIENLAQENSRLSSALENLTIKSQSSFADYENFQVVEQTLESDKLISEVSMLKNKIIQLMNKYDDVKTEINNDTMLNTYLGLFKGNEESSSNNLESFSTNVESPVLFRGFTSSGNDVFEEIAGVNAFFESQPSKQTEKNENASVFNESNLVEGTTLHSPQSKASGAEADINQHQPLSHLLVEPPKGDTLTEITNLKKILELKDLEFASLIERMSLLEKENSNLKNKIEEGNSNKTFWGEDSKAQSELLDQQWGEDLSSLYKQLEEKDSIISNLKTQFSSQTSDLFDAKNTDDPNSFEDGSFSNVFSQSEDVQESKINQFVEQITQLTKILHDKEIEVETLTDKKNKYKEMYFTLIKDEDNQSQDVSSSGKDQLLDQNVILNQLLDDKESELEIMTQQIDQTLSAKENLQEELSLKLSEMEAVNKSYSIQQFPEDVFVQSLQPENIEDVRTLCAEVAELNKLLQERESEVEILKQQLDEAKLEKENLLDEWKKELEMYKEKSNNALANEEVMRKELDAFKDGIVADIEKQYKDELSLKDQQLMNAINDLRNTHSYCKDLQDKINDLENKLQLSSQQNELFTQEINNYKHTQDSLLSLLQEPNDRLDINLPERVQRLQNNLSELSVKFEEARGELKEKEKQICLLRDKVKFSESVSSEDGIVTENQPRQTHIQARAFATEPFRISTEQSSSDDDSSYRNVEHMQNQMLVKEIESLKQVLAMKDNEITRLSIKLNEADENLIRGEMRFINSEEEILRLRLDEALYTLHLRDVRCDELALELMQLLEERDSLQLRLSDAIRFNEELRAKSSLLDETAFKMEGELASPPPQSDDPSSHQLKQKLDQLHNVGYRRDPAMQQDQQRRHQEQMHLYTQPQPQDDSQSSGGFFSWIFGSSSSGPQDI